MCGRYSFAVSPAVVSADISMLESPIVLEPNYNIAPTQQAYIVTSEQPGILQLFQWGLIPYWSKSGRMSSPLINARCETLYEKPSFRLPFQQQRCLVPADSFYEWEKIGRTRKPYRIVRTDGHILCMAGLWDVWKQGDDTIHSFTIVTTRANADVVPLHDRMPVILTGSSMQHHWLEETSISDLQQIFEPPPPGLLTYYPVSDRVNYVKNNDPGLHLALDKG